MGKKDETPRRPHAVAESKEPFRLSFVLRDRPCNIRPSRPSVTAVTANDSLLRYC
jgi:hypothetical protein